MKPWGTPRPWPPDVCDELRSLFSRVDHPGRPRVVDQHLDLRIALDELDAWLDDSRPAERRIKPWDSMVADVRLAIHTRGPTFRQVTQPLDDVLGQLGSPALRVSPTVRQQCRLSSANARAAMREPRAAVSAFDDLVEALLSPASSSGMVEDRMQVLAATLRVADRSLRDEAPTLAGVFDNAAWEVALAHYDLDGTPLPDSHHDLADDAGLSVDERLDLCRRLLAQPTRSGHHVVWVAYERARVSYPSWCLEFGPVTFFNGPTLLSAIDDPLGLREASSIGLPPELVGADEDGKVPRAHVWPEDIEYWVAVRVDLGAAAYADPVRTAREHADALVKVAAFHKRGTSWKPLSGFLHVIDGILRTQSGPFGPPIERRWPDHDHTDAQIDALRPQLAERLPIDDPQVRELIDAAGVLDSSADSTDPTSILQDVRIIELLATRCGQTHWRDHLTQSFAVAWARDEITRTIYNVVSDIVGDDDLRRSGTMPELGELKSRLTTSAPGPGARVYLHHDVALSALPDLAHRLPDHHLRSRRLRTVAARTKSLPALTEWVNELVEDYQRRVERVSRSRNSLAHGGPINLEVVTTVQGFANWQAKVTTYTGLSAVLSGQSVRAAHAAQSKILDQWRSDISSATSVAAVLFDTSESP